MDFSALPSNEIRSQIQQNIAEMAGNYDLQAKKKIFFFDTQNKERYVDVVWYLDAIPIASFIINSRFRTRSIWRLLNFNSLYRIYISFEFLSDEDYSTLKAVDTDNRISLLQLPKCNRNSLVQPRERKIRAAHNYRTKNKKKSKKIPVKIEHPKLSPLLATTYHFYQKGYLISEIALHRDLTESTIVNHFVKIMKCGEYIDIDQFVPLYKQEIILKTVTPFKNPIRLKPIKELLGEEFSYDEIRLVLIQKERYDLFE